MGFASLSITLNDPPGIFCFLFLHSCVALLTEVINPECQVEIELVLHNGGKEEYV